MQVLPALADYESFHAWRADTSRWLPVVSDIAHGHGLKPVSPNVFKTGTNLVVALGAELILKLFPPILRGQFISERASLRQLRGRLGLPIPEILFEASATVGRISS